MRVVIAGGHGQIALLLEQRLSDRGDQPVAIIRNPDHLPDVEKRGAEAVVLDLEKVSVSDVARVVAGSDAVVFAAGAGPGSSAARKETVDKDAAILLADAAEQEGVRRYLMVSSMGADDADPASNDVFQLYLRAKAAADDNLRGRDLDWTIIRPGHLTNEPGTGCVTTDPTATHRDIPRADVAHALATALGEPVTVRKQFTLCGGPTPIEHALRTV